MNGHDELSDRDADLIRAAEAAASWARARRASWTSQPLGAAPISSEVPVPEAYPEISEPYAKAPDAYPEIAKVPDAYPEARSASPPSPAPMFAEPSASPSYAALAGAVVERITTSVRAIPASAIRWVALAAVVAAFGTAAFVGVPYLWRALPTIATKAPAVEPAKGRASAAPRRATGGLRVVSTPAGARVMVDGKARGVTPLTLSDLNPGNHEVALASDAGTVHRTVTVAANETAQVDESIFSGWLAVYAPFEITIAESGRMLRPDERNQILLPPGVHELRIANKTLAYEATWSVEIKPGEKTNLRVTPEPSTLTVTASEAAEVLLDGARLGETPLNAAPVPLGTHELVVKRAAGGERRFTITVGVKPFTLNVDFR